MTATKTFLKDLLHSNDLKVVFTKKDGTERSMLCTLRKEALPELKETTNKKEENSEVLAVWDLEKEAFRSFRLESLISYTLNK